MKIRMLALLACVPFIFVGSACYANSADAGSHLVDNLDDRLETPSPDLSDIHQSLFIDVQNVGSRIVAVGERGSIVYSNDLGNTWRQANVPVSTLLTAVYFSDETHGWAVGHGGVILHTSDGGLTWVKQFDGNQANQMVMNLVQAQYDAVKEEYEQANEDDKEDLAYALEDMAFVLEDATIDYDNGPAKPFLDVWFKNRDEGFVIGAYGFFFYTNNGGKTWQYVADRLENFDRYHLNAIAMLQGGALMIVGEAGQMFVSYDDGLTWETLFGPYQGSFFGLQATEEEGGVIAFGLRGHIFKSDDAGGSWRRINVALETTLTASDMSINGELVIVGFSGAILKSSNQGEDFIVTQKNRFDSYNGVAVLNDQIVLAGDIGLETANE